MPTIVPPQTADANQSGPVQLALLPAQPRVAQPARSRALHWRAWIAVSIAADAAMLALAGVLAAGEPRSQVLLGAVALAEMGRRRLYSSRSTRAGILDTARSSLAAVALAALVTLAAAAIGNASEATTDGVLRTWLAASVTVPISRIALTLWRRQAYARGLTGRRTLIVGAGAIGSQLEQRMLANPALGMNPIGYLDADPAPDARRTAPVLGSPDVLEQVVESGAIDYVIVAFSSAPDSEVLPLLRRCERLGLDVAVVPRLFENVNTRQRVEHVGGLPLLAMRTPQRHSWEYVAKHVFDRALAAVLIVLLSPVLIASALAIKLSSRGPVLFRQRRVGRDDRAFDILKFRSMEVARDTPDELLRKRLASAGSAPGGVEGADRRTRVGALLRRTSLDELPQLFNVLRGQMSLVGPRPERPEFVELFESDYLRYGDRHRVKSGMTGWAQVHGLRGQTSLADRVEWDNWYIQNWSLWLDFKILLKTPLEILRSQAESAR